MRRHRGVLALLFALAAVAVFACRPHPPKRDEDGGAHGASAPRALALDHGAREACACTDGTLVSTCAGGCGAVVDDCTAACADHRGLAGESCFAGDFDCLLEDTRDGESGVVCRCAFGDRAACTTLGCDADAATIAAVCAAACGAPADAACAEADDGCASFAVPSGRDRATCACADGGSVDVCASGVCAVAAGAAAAARVCAAACADAGGALDAGASTCTAFDAACTFPTTGDNALLCTCDDGGGAPSLGVCTSAACDVALVDARHVCQRTCGRAAFDVACVEQEPQCAALGAPRGADRLTCACDDGAFVDACTVACTGDCAAICGAAAHAGAGVAVGCDSAALACTLGERGPNGLVCNCQAGDTTALCSDVACDDVGAFHALCLQSCLGDNLVGARCFPSDDGCAAGVTPHGGAAVTCACDDGAHLDACVPSCAGVADVVCVPRCEGHGGVTGASCVADSCDEL